LTILRKNDPKEQCFLQLTPRIKKSDPLAGEKQQKSQTHNYKKGVAYNNALLSFSLFYQITL
tara:strand:- start:221 stop:406 length:186 start_codon:yes stop_codon:yes gene_type:complete